MSKRNGVNIEREVFIHEPDFSDYQADDRANVSKLHRELQHRAVKWMSNRLSPCYASVEIGYGAGVTCDALGVGFWIERLRDAVDDRWRRRSVVIRCEAKATRQDFMSSFGPRAKDMAASAQCGNLRFLVKPKKVLMPTELLPAGWGILEAYGSGLSIAKKADWHELPSPNDAVAALIAIVHLGMFGKRQLRVACPDCGRADSGNPL